jgi:hypothetical protein
LLAGCNDRPSEKQPITRKGRNDGSERKVSQRFVKTLNESRNALNGTIVDDHL